MNNKRHRPGKRPRYLRDGRLQYMGKRYAMMLKQLAPMIRGAALSMVEFMNAALEAYKRASIITPDE
jgi:hypothetical protein